MTSVIKLSVIILTYFVMNIVVLSVVIMSVGSMSGIQYNLNHIVGRQEDFGWHSKQWVDESNLSVSQSFLASNIFNNFLHLFKFSGFVMIKALRSSLGLASLLLTSLEIESFLRWQGFRLPVST
jgi:hypothetical protein